MRAANRSSNNSDSAAAIAEVVDGCLSDLAAHGQRPFAALAFCGIEHDAEAIANGLRSGLGDIPVIGCSTDGEITSRGLHVDSVTLMVLASQNVSATAVAIESIGSDSDGAGKNIATRLNSEQARAMILLPDGLTGNGSAIISGAQEVLGPDFVIGGGTAGDRGRFEKTWQICNGQVYSDSLVGMMLHSTERLEIGYGVMSGWRPIGLSKTVTRAEGNTVFSIDDQSALDVYSSYLGEKSSQLPAIGVEYPFGLVDESGRVGTQGLHQGEEYILMRAPMSVDRENGAVTFAAEIPEGAKIKMTRAKSTDIIEGSRVAADRALKQLGGSPDVVLFFSCMARKVVLGRRTEREIHAAQEVFGDGVPMAGFYTYGEIANCGDQFPTCRFHNETATFLAFREA